MSFYKTPPFSRSFFRAPLAHPPLWLMLVQYIQYVLILRDSQKVNFDLQIKIPFPQKTEKPPYRVTHDLRISLYYACITIKDSLYFFSYNIRMIYGKPHGYPFNNLIP
jgi:hypothetical protein